MTAGAPPTVHIHYRRLPDRTVVFHQLLLLDEDAVKVTLAREMEMAEPLVVGGRTILEPGSDVVWFTFPGAWHDIGRFHTADGTFQGLYANILTPPTFHEGGIWRTTDLFLDVWLPAGATELTVLDQAAFADAVRDGLVDPGVRQRALNQVEAILDGWVRGRWPPPVVESWTLEQALRVAGDARPRVEGHEEDDNR